MFLFLVILRTGRGEQEVSDGAENGTFPFERCFTGPDDQSSPSVSRQLQHLQICLEADDQIGAW